MLNVYREVDNMFRELAGALGDNQPQFVPLVRRLVPGAGSKNPDARYLRNYHAWVFAPADASDEDEDEDEDEEDGEDEEGEVEKSKRTLTLKTGSGIVVARAAIYERGISGFEPNLSIAVLNRCRVETAVPVGTQVKIGRGKFKRVVRAVDAHRNSSAKALQTGVPVQVAGQSKKLKLSFDTPALLPSLPLFEVTPEKVHEIAAKVRKEWIPTNAA